MQHYSVNERSSAVLKCSFLDPAGVLAVPAAVSYRVWCTSSGTEIRPDTPVTPAAEVEILLTSDDTVIVDEAKPHEMRSVFVTASYGAGDQVIEVFRLRVRNLAGVS